MHDRAIYCTVDAFGIIDREQGTWKMFGKHLNLTTPLLGPVSIVRKLQNLVIILGASSVTFLFLNEEAHTFQLKWGLHEFNSVNCCLPKYKPTKKKMEFFVIDNKSQITSL
eukprot:CAMPEP_0170565026 /NCGR_PEP_ID=MMETSP0211-20121228/76311_1 /TAXON_ID=311385 /ORGANISM="Pseudokeronopsis sp., Strain OXSARD2" /LENGTH=110 /DNA_ID=CAMNT_0010885265 /DNA_START=356 /DNA_END=685 /DNA_ORIENTATION=-